MLAAIDGLLPPETELRGMTVDEAWEIRRSLAHGDADAPARLASFADLAARMERLEPLTAKGRGCGGGGTRRSSVVDAIKRLRRLWSPQAFCMAFPSGRPNPAKPQSVS
jgi:hypothetical protein